MTNPFEIETLTVQYSSTLDILLQQEVSKLRHLVDAGSHVGKMASMVQQIAPVEFRQLGPRFSTITFQQAQFVRRWVSPQDRDCGVPVDTFDQLKTIVNPMAGINRVVLAGAQRFFDDVIIAAAFASAQTGVDASSLQTELWPTSTFLVADTFDAAASTGMTYSKIVEGRRLLEHYQNDLDREMVTLVVGSQQNSDLLKQMEVVDSGLKISGMVEGGKVRNILDTNIIGSERLNTSSSNALRNCIMFVRSGLYLGLWKEMELDASQRKDLVGHPWQLYAIISAGATRTQLGKLIQINAADTSGADPTAP